MKSSQKKKSSDKLKKNAKAPRQSFTVKPANLSLEDWQRALRTVIAQKGNFSVAPIPGKASQGYYSVKKPIYAKVTLKTVEGSKPKLLGYGTPYTVVYRGDGSKWNFCSCMDFKTSGLGTCKHIEAVKCWLDARNKRPARVLPNESSVYIDYADSRKIKLRIGSNDKDAISSIAKEYFDQDGVFRHADTMRIYEFVDRVNQVSGSCRCYDDVYEAVNETMRRRELALLSNSVDDALIQSLMKTTLFGYQLEGVKFAFAHGRTIIADEMGLGKTIQAIATAELMRHFHLATSVLIVCPTSLKYQWKHEIEKFTGSSVTVVEGNPQKRKEIYERGESYYKIVSYNALANDIKYQGQIITDMLVMDEVQRLKNWDTQIAKAARNIKSSFTVLLSGTPLENKLEELYSIVELVDQYALSPYYAFREKYIVTDSAGMTIGYKNLNEITHRLKDILIRRRKCEVAMQMPARMDKTLYVPMTKEQKAMHNELEYKVSIIVHKWRNYHFLSEQDRLRLLMLLGQMRMVANSSFILDQHTRFDTKVEEVCDILRDIFASSNEKVVIFSGWERMTRLIAAELDKMGVKYSNLNGSVPSIKRKRLVEDFTNDPECRVFLSTDAGATGLNLQAGSTIINIELPWNPAVHEQRIGRIYRLGQMRNIQVINMVSVDSIEQDIETKLQFKSAVAGGILDNGEDSVYLPKKKFDEIIETLDKIMEEKEAASADVSLPESTVDDSGDEAEAPLCDDDISTDTTGIPKDDDDDTIEEPCAPDSPISEPSQTSDGDSSPNDTPTPQTPHSPSDSTSQTPSVNPDCADMSPHSTTHPDTPNGDAASHTPAYPDTPNEDAASNPTERHESHVAQSSELVKQGVSFLSGLAETLRSPERTRALVDEIVKTDETTGQTSIQIPVADKQVVTNLLSVFGALFSK